MGTSVQNFFTSRDNNVDPATYVGQLDRLWYNPDTNQIFISDGSTPGGRPVDLGANANALINTLTVSNVTSPSGTVQLVGNITVTGNISPAANNKIGGIAPGPGVEISNTGLLTIDSAGLPISFGDFFANVNQLSIVNANEDMYLVSNGTGNINLIGGVNFYKPNGFPPSTEPFFRVKNDGQIQILVPVEDPVEGGVEIVGSAAGTYIPPGQPGAMLHLTGNPGTACRMYIDGNGDYASIVARRYNGNVASPTQVLANEYVLRINATAATDAGVGNIALAQIQFQALENQTTTAQGSALNFVVTPVGSPANARVEVANITVANGVSATKFTTAGTVSATGNITGGNVAAATFTGNVVGNVTGTASTATNLAAATSILAGTLTIDPANINKTSASTQTFTLTGLTTSHKVVITAGTALTYGVGIVSAWASNADTLSITFHNYTGGGINLGSTDIQYFAWI